jgi:hypothetical protein
LCCRGSHCSVVNPRPQVNPQPDFLPISGFGEKTLLCGLQAGEWLEKRYPPEFLHPEP